ncbi:site-specific integrase [Citrobacter sp. Awk 4]|uniref:tyrosine-type recombinase/integrase n=1 Tax=Citrobacter sp. Awk 4 TaxID=2963955 RepID=UPI002303AD7B|nr:site-specific integrase [Citrobacter sp. Awk 4]MDA8479851.1 site-specific integrase [Citrobacter sp. Awk 4]
MAALPTGVEIRGSSLCIWFMYRGKRCREILKGWVVTASNIKKAGNLRSLILSEIAMDEFDYRFRFPASKKISTVETTVNIRTMGELSTLWLNIKETELAANTMRKTRSQLDTLRHIVGEETPIITIRHSDILNYRNELLSGETLYRNARRGNKIGRTVRTVDNYISLLCTVLRFAYQSGFIRHKPFEGVKKLQKSRAKPDPLSKQEFDQLMASETGQSQNMWRFAVYTGLRHGELAALAWEDVDLETGTVRVCRNLTIIGTFGPPKTDAGIRTIKLLEPALDALKAQSEMTALQPKTKIVFQHREYGKTENQRVHFVFMPRMRKGEQKPYYSMSSIGARWNAAVKRAGIRRRNPYHTRHTFACWLLSAGANPSFIANQMGHENAQMVYEVYSTWIEEMNGDQVAMLNNKLAL